MSDFDEDENTPDEAPEQPSDDERAEQEEAAKERAEAQREIRSFSRASTADVNAAVADLTDPEDLKQKIAELYEAGDKKGADAALELLAVALKGYGEPITEREAEVIAAISPEALAQEAARLGKGKPGTDPISHAGNKLDDLVRNRNGWLSKVIKEYRGGNEQGR